MRIPVSATCILFVSLGLSSSPQVPGSAGRILVKIDKPAPSGIPEDLALRFRAVQELASCWIAESSGADFELLRQLGGSGGILDESPEGKAFYLASGVAPEQIPALELLGHVTPVEDGIVLFWSENDDFWDRIPEPVHLKALPEDTRLRIAFPAGKTQDEPRQPVIAGTFDLPNPAITNMVASVSRADLSSYIQDLQNFQTRRTTTSNCEAAGTYIYNYFAAQGFAPEYDIFGFTYQGTQGTARNIVATIPGRTAPEQVVIVGAHYDSTSNQPLVLAPGADDDASGTAAVMEIARIMRDQPFDCSVRFICFSAEEIGLIGSRHYAQTAAAAGESIVGMIQLDMIAYASRVGEDLDVISNTPSSWLADLFLYAATTYTTLPATKWIQPSAVGSDHSPFWDQGFSAILAIESYPLVNPYYHKVTDTIATLDLDFETSVAKAALATAAALAQPVGSLLAPADVTAQSATVRSLLRRFKNVSLTWIANDADATGYNIYRSPATHIQFQKVNAATVSGTHYVDRYLPPDGEYYYAITAVDSQGRESGYSKRVLQ